MRAVRYVRVEKTVPYGGGGYTEDPVIGKYFRSVVSGDLEARTSRVYAMLRPNAYETKSYWANY